MEKLNEMLNAGAYVCVFMHPKSNYDITPDIRISVECKSRDGDKLEINVKADHLETAVDEAHVRWARHTKAAPQFDHRLLLGQAGEVLNDEIPF